MKEEFKILYFYFFGPNGKVNKIPRKIEKHKEKLLENVRRIYPSFMHPYSAIYGNGLGQDEVVMKVINIFNNHRVKFFHRLKSWFGCNK